MYSYHILNSLFQECHGEELIQEKITENIAKRTNKDKEMGTITIFDIK